ncbi:S8 family peptidase [Staphylococcus felis]|uniref:S8 family peptidase n=3 Tax=Staphylococcus felis TaxID=46127 RepID=UPI0015F27356|nr:S8 family serine peptidase [Staphylococcus felis]
MTRKEYEIIFKQETRIHKVIEISQIINAHNKILTIKVCYAYLSIKTVKWLKSLDCVIRVNDTTFITQEDFFRNQSDYDSIPMTKEKRNIRNKQWDIIKLTNNRKSYRLHNISRKIKIALIDSGIDKDHIDLKHSILRDSKNLVPKGGFNNTEIYEDGNISNFDDVLGHGTSVAGQITANGVLQGIAPGIGINVYRVFGSKVAKTSWIIQAIIEAVDDGNHVINLSVGSYLLKNGSYINGKNDYEGFLVFQRAIEYAHSKNVIIVSTLGNDALNLKSHTETNDFIQKKNSKKISSIGQIIDAPSNFKGVIKSYSIDRDNKISSYSNWGYDNLAISTYGGKISSYCLNNYNDFIQKNLYETDWILSTHLQNSYNFFYGNSMATPKISATIALIIDKFNIFEYPQLAIRHLFNNSYYANGNFKIDTYRCLNTKLSF